MDTEDNLLLAKFIGGKTSGEWAFFIGEDEIWLPKFGICLKENKYGKSLDFDTDWNWLMKVVEKIESLKYFFNSGPFVDDSTQELTGEYWCAINQLSSNLKPENFIDVCGCDSKLKATYKACVEFVKWFNQQNNEK